MFTSCPFNLGQGSNYDCTKIGWEAFLRAETLDRLIKRLSITRDKKRGISITMDRKHIGIGKTKIK